MFPDQRINIIKQILLDKKQIEVNSLTSLLKVSNVTIRKDLDALEKEGFLRKVHGGAILVEDSTPEIITEESSATQEHERIASIAITLIEDGDNFYLGPGATCLALAKKLNQKKNLTVITNNASALPYLNYSSINLLFIGGDVISYNNQMFTHGKKALAYLDDIFVNKAFISSDCIDIDAGVTINHSYSLEIYKKILERSRQIILVATNNKFDKTALQLLCPLSKISVIVTDSDPSDRYKQYLFQNNIKLLTFFDL